MILWIKYTGNIQFSLEHRVVYISTIYYVFIIWLYFTPNFIFLYSYNYIICMGGCSHTVCLWMFAPTWIRPPCRIHSAEGGEAPTIVIFGAYLLLFGIWGAAAMWHGRGIMSAEIVTIRSRNLKLGRYVEHRGGWKMLGADFWICPWLTP